MKKRNSKWIILLLTMILIAATAPVVPVQAASATITLSTTAEEIRVGDRVEVTLTIAADETIGDFEGYLKYDDSIFEFYSAASCITGGAGILRISDMDASPSAQERSYKIYFKAVEKGECKIEIYNRPVVYCYADGTEMSVTGFGKSFLVYPAYSASDDSTLASLHLIDSRVETIVLSPVFSPEITEYYASVPYEAESVIVSAIAADKSSSVKVSGTGPIVPGANTVCVTVTAEDGTDTKYTVHLYRNEVPTPPEEENPEDGQGGETSGNQGEEQPTLPEVVLTPGVVLETSESDILITEYHTYRVCEKPESFALPEGYVETTLMIDQIKVTAYAKQGDTEEFLLLVLANEHGQVQWYRYDRVEQTLQRISEEEFVINQVTISNDEEWRAVVQQYQVQQAGLNIALALVSGICVFLLVIIVWLCIRNRRVKDER